VRDDSGHIVAINGTATDITKLKELQRLRDEWTSVIAHDLRQPIGTILMASGVLPELTAEMSDNARAMVQRIHTASLALKRMVDDLLDMSLLEANRLKLERKWSKPSSLVQETLGQLAHLPGIERVHVVNGSEPPAIFVDPMRVQQVIANLISNAIKYGDPKSDVDVRVAHTGTAVEITVTNRGHGIPPDELPRLFSRFTRSPSTRGSGVRGLGLGLYIAKGVVEAHGGRIWAESTPDTETTFHVTLPAPSEMHEAA
jgi:signal transduction histidine kinase